MKFRDKETGKIQTCDMVVITDEPIDGEIASLNKHTFIFRSIEQFNDECEAYKPVEPLIKDDKVRKAVRAWADANDIDSNFYHTTAIKFNPSEHRFTWIDTSIEFDDLTGLVNLKRGKKYTITELCGEEEE